MASSACIAPPSSRNKTTTTSRSSSSPFASSSSSAFAPRPSPFLTRPSSPTRLSMSGRFSSPPSYSSSSSSPQSLKFSVDRPISPRRSMSVTKPRNNPVSSNNNKKIMCACAPTSHPGSFRCSYHKRLAEQEKSRAASSASSCQQSAASMSLNLRRSAMKNSLVRIGGVEGELAKRTLTTLIRPSSHQQRRREAFQPRPSRFAITSKAGEV